jgi:hypothetical protein
MNIGENTRKLIKDAGCRLMIRCWHGLWDARLKFPYPWGYCTFTDGQGDSIAGALQDLEGAVTDKLARPRAWYPT